jgi:hypothetical protein
MQSVMMISLQKEYKFNGFSNKNNLKKLGTHYTPRFAAWTVLL